MTKVLTIDFDILLWKSLPLYNNFIPNLHWDQVMGDYPLLKYIEFDNEIYQKLTRMIMRLSKKVDAKNIHFIENHQAVIKHLPINDLIELTNIDHHHDIQYNEKEPTDELNCGNWVKYAYTHGYNIIKYSWINNTNSIECFFDHNHYLTNTQRVNSFDFSQYDYDEIIICLSPQWVPPTYYPLYYTWMDILNRIYNTTFSIES